MQDSASGGYLHAVGNQGRIVATGTGNVHVQADAAFFTQQHASGAAEDATLRFSFQCAVEFSEINFQGEIVHLDWRLQERGFRFVRYADDFVVLTQTHAQAEEACTLVTQTLTELGLSLSTEKTRITTYGKGYSFLGFVLSRRSRRMRDKSKRKLQDKVRTLTVRAQNLDAQVIVKLNQVIRGSASLTTFPPLTPALPVEGRGSRSVRRTLPLEERGSPSVRCTFPVEGRGRSGSRSRA